MFHRLAVAGLTGRWRARTGRLASLVIPDLEERVFNRDRNRLFPASRPRRGRGVSAPVVPREPHIVIAPTEGPWSDEWGPAMGNYYYEVYRTAVERFGQGAVSVLDLQSSSMNRWSKVLEDLIQDTRATHLISHLERDPGDVGGWTWDYTWTEMSRSWDGVFVGVTFDSGFRLLEMKARRLARISPNFVCLDICVPMDSRLVPNRVEVGPVPLVVSHETQTVLAEEISSVEKTTDVSFVGALYPYRVELMDALTTAGIDVAVNPHRSDVTTDFESSRRDQPDWLSYMTGLAGSQMTINFSLSSSGNHEQLKWRVMEAALVGALLLTDDHSRTSEFFVRGEEFDEFTRPDDLARVIAAWLDSPSQLRQAQRRAQQRAFELTRHEFWNRIEKTLAVRSLPRLPASSG